MTQNKITRTALVIAAITGVNSLIADEAPARNQGLNAEQASAPHYELDEYVVSARTYAVPIQQVGSKVELITREDLEISQSTFVIDALRELPGVLIRNNGGIGNAFSTTVRGLNGDRPIVLIDGIEVSDPTTGNIINPGTIFTNSIEKIEFLKGSQSALYGADALAGVINMTTRKAAPGETSGSFSAGGGTYSTREGSANLLMNRGKWNLSAGLSRYVSDGFSSQDNNKEKDEYRNTAANLKISYDLTDDLEVYLTSYFIESFSEYDVSAFDTSGESDSQQLFAKAGVILQATDIWHTELSFGYNDVDRTNESISWGTAEFQGFRYETQWRNVVEVNERWTIAAGAEYDHEENRDTDAMRTDESLYIDNNFEVVEDLFWSIGGRYDHTNDYGTKQTWRSTVSYLLESINTRFHASYGTSFSAPSLYNLTYNPELKYQEGKGWDYGVEITLLEDRLIADVTAFGYDIDDKMTWDPTAPGVFPGWPGAMVNEGYESNGVEASVIWHIQTNLSVKGNYTYTNATSDIFSEPLYTPEHQANLSVTWKTLEEKLSLKGSILYVGERNAQYGSTESSPDYATVNLAGQYQVNETLSFWAAANNILDKHYQEIVGYNTPGANFKVGVRVDF